MPNLALPKWQVPLALGLGTLAGRALDVFRELYRREPVLTGAGWLHLLALLVIAAVDPLDARTLDGVSVWLKPMKFAFAIGLYLWTLGWLLHHLKPTDQRAVTVLGRAVALVMSFEFLLITSQAARGVASHFNGATVYDVLVYRAMGLLILLNTIALVQVTILYFRRRPQLPLAYLWGIRLGLTLFLLTTVSGGVMVGIASHTFGISGDLRHAHFISNHALQAMPLAGLTAYRLQLRGNLRHALRWTIAAAVVLFGLHAALLGQALAGRALL